jgi:hypothetical protein
MARFLAHVRAWFEFDLAYTRHLLLRWAPEVEPFFSAPALWVLRRLDAAAER